MPRLTQSLPKYRLHKASGHAIVTLNGRDFYLGAYGSPESKTEYDRLLAEYLTSARKHPAPKTDSSASSELTLNEVFVHYWNEHVVHYYVKHGSPTNEQHNIKLATGHLLKLYGDTLASDFGPLALKAYRQHLIDIGHYRSGINKDVDRVKRMLKWAGANEIISPLIYDRLRCVGGLRRGRSKAKESQPVRPVDEADIEAVVALVAPEIKAMIRLQLLTGMRPQEVTLMHSDDIEIEDELWWYRPRRHKTEHHGRERAIPLGPEAQAILRPWLGLDSIGYLFSPKRAHKRRMAERRAGRETPMTPSQRSRKRKQLPRKSPGEHYSTPSYGRAIAEACKRAGVARWSPNQLRHNAATRLRKQFGIEAARTILGHASAAVTEVYAEMDLAKAAEIMKQVG